MSNTNKTITIDIGSFPIKECAFGKDGSVVAACFLPEDPSIISMLLRRIDALHVTPHICNMGVHDLVHHPVSIPREVSASAACPPPACPLCGEGSTICDSDGRWWLVCDRCEIAGRPHDSAQEAIDHWADLLCEKRGPITGVLDNDRLTCRYVNRDVDR